MSNRYSTDKGMQNLFESFRTSLNEEEPGSQMLTDIRRVLSEYEKLISFMNKETQANKERGIEPVRLSGTTTTANNILNMLNDIGYKKQYSDDVVALGEGRMKHLESEIVNSLMEMMQQYDVTLEDIKDIIDSGAVQDVMDMLSDKNRPPREPVTPEDTKRMYTKTI